MKLNFNKNLILATLVVLSVFVALSCVSAASANPIADDGGNFVMSVPYNSGTGYHWEVSPDSFGVELVSMKNVQDHPGACGTSGTSYFTFHIVDADNYYAKLVCISPAGKIVKEVDSDMVN